jgi:acetyltransferase-like isoleucine patch superfamily enzyme
MKRNIAEKLPPSESPFADESDLELKAFLEFRETGKISLKHSIPLGIKAVLTDVPFAFLRYWPGPVGMKLRQFYYKLKLKQMGTSVLFGTGVEAIMPKRISISDYVFIDNNVTLNALAGEIVIGRRIHIAPNAIIAGTGGIYLGDYSAVGAFARIYSHSEAPIDGKRMSGPMIPESMKGMITAPVRLEKDSLVGTGAVVLPGVTIGEGAIVGANSLVPSGTTIPPWTIYVGVPARFAGLRKKVTVPDN